MLRDSTDLPDRALRAELGAVVILGIGVARMAGTLPNLAAADPDQLGALADDLLRGILG
jgi:hypothetical protein